MQIAMAEVVRWAQRLSPPHYFGRLRPIDLGLLWIVELDATGFGIFTVESCQVQASNIYESVPR